VRQGDAEVDGVLSGVLASAGGGLVKLGGGTLALTAENTYGGGTTVDEGRLLVNNGNTAQSGTGTGAVTVNAGTLGGTGSIGGPVTIHSGAHLAPGESIESLDVASLTLSSGSILDFELDTVLGVDTSDLVNVTLADGLTINLATLNLTDAGAMTDGTYTLFDYAGTLGGSVANITFGTTPGGFDFQLVDNVANTSIDLVVTAAQPQDVAGDYNDNGVVDAADYVLWRKRLGTDTQLDNEVPGVTEGSVTPDDYDAWRNRFGNTAGGGAGALAGQVPEPATIALLAFALPLVARRRRSGPPAQPRHDAWSRL
jgi:fibronectin-binding autotransporter adhesin